MTEPKQVLPKGVYTALVTPFADGELDKKAWRRLVERQLIAGVAGLVPVGCTGEAAALSLPEREWLVRTCIEIADGRAYILVGSGTNVTASTIELTVLAAEWGADAAMLISPYYNKPQQHGLIAHYTAAAQAVDLPIVIYNVPGRTAVNILPSTIKALGEVPNIAAVKEASGDMNQIGRICEDGAMQVFSGDDGLNLEIFRRGAHGAVSVLSNLLPGHLVRLWNAWDSGDAAEATRLSELTAPVVEACFREVNPVPSKELLSLSGLCTSELRLPLVPALPENRKWLQEFHSTTLGPLLEEDA